MSRLTAGLQTTVDQAVAARVREGRLRDERWPFGLRAVVGVGIGLFVLATLLALFAGPLRGLSELSVPNSLTSSVPTGVTWVLVFLLAFCLALFATAAIHGPWWLAALGLVATALLLGTWASVTTVGRGMTGALALAMGTVGTLLVLRAARRRRVLAWWEFPLVLGLIGLVLAVCTHDYAVMERERGFRWIPLFLDQTASLLTYLVLPAAFAAGAAVAEIAVGLTTVATRTAQRAASGRWPYVVLAVLVLLRLVQETVRLGRVDPVDAGWYAFLPAIGLVLAFGALGWTVSRLSPVHEVPVGSLPDDLGRIGVPVGAAVVALMLPVIVYLFGFQIVLTLRPQLAAGLFDPSPLVDRLIDGFRAVLGAVLVVIALWRARRGQPGLALVLGCSGLLLIGLGARLLTGYRWALWLEPDALVSVITLVVLVVTVVLGVRGSLTPNRALGLAAVLALAALLSLRSVVADPLGALLGIGGVGFVLFGVSWDFLTGSAWANTDGPRVSRPVRVLLAVGYPLLTVTIVASDALIRRARTFSDVNAFAELGELILGTGLLAAASVVLLSAVRGDREIV